MKSAFEGNGFCQILSGLSEGQCQRLERGLRAVIQGESEVVSHGVRDLLKRSPGIRRQVSHGPIYAFAAEALGKPCRPVKGLYFDKCPEANWMVPWHQDLTIALEQQHAVSGFSNWTRKQGAVHAQPPVSFLQGQVTLRMHLDDCPESNGALRVIPGSHRMGRLRPDQIQELRETLGVEICAAKRGDVLVMSPLLLHSSPKAQQPAQRRVVHVEFSAARLPASLRWFV